MNSFSLSKFLTGVVFVLVAVNVSAASKDKEESKAAAAEALSVYKQCSSDCSIASYEDRCSADDFPDKGDKRTCKNKLVATCKDDCKTDYNAAIGAQKEQVTSCKEAYNKWSDKVGDQETACSAFDKSLGKTCDDQVKACKSKIDGTFASNGNESGDQNLAMIMQIAKQKIGTSSNAIASDAVTGGAPCVEAYDAKTQVENEKEFTRQKRELDARVKKETDEQAKQNEKLREKKDEIAKKITELEAKLKKSEESRAKASSEAATAYQKKVVESGKVIRSLTTAILQEQQKLTKSRFASQTALLELTDDKILNRCKQQLISVKNALVSNTSATGTSATDAQIKGIKDSIGTGAKGTANLNAYLKQIKDACFQQENTKKQSAMLQATQDTESANSRIEELQKSVKDEENSLKIAKDANDTASKQAATEKTNEVNQKEKDAANLNTELQNFSDSVNEKMKISKAEAAKVTEEIQELTLKKQFNVKPAFSDAQKVITTANKLRSAALDACDCDGSGKGKAACSALSDSTTGEKETKPAGGSSSKTQGER